MKPRILSPARLSFPLASAIAALLAGVAATSIHAAALFWDGTDSTADADGGNGTWNTSTANWDSAATSGANATWNSATPDTATFGGTVGTVTLGAPILSGGLTFNHASGTYTVSAGSSNVLMFSTTSAGITTTAGGTTNITAPLFLAAAYNGTFTNNGALSLSSLILGTTAIVNPTTTNLTIGSVTSTGQTFTLGGSGGGDITGVISLNNAGLTKAGGGTWTLSNSNNLWNGSTTINQGTLKLGASSALGYGTNILTFSNSATSAFLDLAGRSVTVGQFSGATNFVGTVTNNTASSISTLTFGSNNTTSTFTGKILDNGTGQVALTKIGTGTITLNGNATNTFSGGLNLNGGTLLLDSLNLATPNDLVGNTNTLALGGGALQIKAKATVTTNQTLGNVTVNAGGGQIISTNNSATNITNITLGSLTTSAAGGSLLVGTNVAAGIAGLTITTTTDKDAQGIYGGRAVFFNGTANTGYDLATTASGSSPYTLSAYSGYSALITAGGTDTANSRITSGDTLLADLVTNSLKIENPAASQTLDLGIQLLTLSSGGLLVTGTNATSISGTGVTGLTAANGSGAYDLLVHQFNSGGLTISAVIGNNGGNATSLTKAGTGALTLSGTNTFTGRTYLNGGTLNVNAASTTAGTTLVAGSILNLSNASGLGSGDLTMNGGTFNNTTGSPLTLSNALNINGDVTFNSSALQNITQQTGAVTLTGNRVITVSNNTVTINGSIGGSGGFYKLGAGTLTLGGATNTFTGPIVINNGVLLVNSAITSTQIRLIGSSTAGILRLGASDVLPSNTTVAVDGQGSGTTFDLQGFNQTISTLTLGNNAGGSKAQVIGTGSSKLTLTGGIATSNHNNGAGGNITVPNLDLNGTTQNFFLGGHGSGTDELSISSVIQNGGVNIIGTIATAAATFSSANTYSGSTSINLALLRLAHLSALQNSPLDTSGTGIIGLFAGAGSYTLGGLTGGKNLASVITGTPTNLTTLILNPGVSTSYTYSGVISNLSTGMALTKTGAGTQILTNTNSYTGATTVSGGTLLVNSPGSLNAASAVAVGTGSGGTLGGTGTISGSVTVAADGSLSPGNAALPGLLTIGGGLDISAPANGGAGKLVFQLDALANTSDKIAVAGTLTIGSGVLGFNDFTFSNYLSGLEIGTYKLITGGSAPVGTLDGANLTGTIGSFNAALQINGNDLELVVTAGGPGPVDHFVISAIGSPQTVGTAITGITITAEDASNATATGFTGTVTFSGTGGFSGASGSFTLGQLTGVSVTPTISGSNLTLIVTDGVSGKTGSTTITTIQTQYAAWSGGASFDADTNGDGVKNGLAFLLGAANPSENALTKLPVVTESGGNLVLTFSCLNASKRGDAVLSLQQSSDLGISDAWLNAAVPETSGGPVNGVTFAVTPGSPLNSVVATVSSSEAASGKLFSRLNAVITP